MVSSDLLGCAISRHICYKCNIRQVIIENRCQKPEPLSFHYSFTGGGPDSYERAAASAVSNCGKISAMEVAISSFVCGLSSCVAMRIVNPMHVSPCSIVMSRTDLFLLGWPLS